MLIDSISMKSLSLRDIRHGYCWSYNIVDRSFVWFNDGRWKRKLWNIQSGCGNLHNYPSLSGYTFSPTNISVTVGGVNITGVNFTATQPSLPFHFTAICAGV